MPRITKTIQDKDGNDLEVYSDNCNKCSKEMVFPKSECDKVEKIFPFLKDRIEAGSPCVECAMEDEKNGKYLFTEEEINIMKATMTKE